MSAEVAIDTIAQLGIGATRVVVMARGERDRSAAVELALASLLPALGYEPTWAVRHDARGRPFLIAAPEQPAPAISISHSGGVTAVAVGPPGPLGVDIEQVRTMPAVTALAHRRFTSGEQSMLRQATDPTRAFLRIWTAKEAVAKSVGQGLRAALAVRTQATTQDSPRILSHPGRRVTNWQVQLDPHSPHADRQVIGAIAVPSLSTGVRRGHPQGGAASLQPGHRDAEG